MDIVKIYLLFNRSCAINGLKPRGGGVYPIYDIVRICVPNSPLFSGPRYMITPPPPFKKKVYEWHDFWNWNGPNFLTLMYMHIFLDQIPVKPLSSHLHKSGFLMTRVICKLFTNHRWYERVYTFKEQYMKYEFSVKSSIWIGCFFSKAGYMIRIGFKILTCTPEPKLSPVPPSPPPTLKYKTSHFLCR